MPQIHIWVPQMESAEERLVEVPDDVPLKQIAPYLAIQMGLRVERDGQPIQWEFFAQGKKFIELDSNKTLAFLKITVQPQKVRLWISD